MTATQVMRSDLGGNAFCQQWRVQLPVALVLLVGFDFLANLHSTSKIFLQTQSNKLLRLQEEKDGFESKCYWEVTNLWPSDFSPEKLIVAV